MESSTAQEQMGISQSDAKHDIRLHKAIRGSVQYGRYVKPMNERELSTELIVYKYTHTHRPSPVHNAHWLEASSTYST